MHKWTTSNFHGGMSTTTAAQNKVTLAKILTVRPKLNEVECWALLGQTAHALQDVLLRANGSGKRNQECPVVYPERILASTTGRITFDNTSFDAKPEYIHPLLGSNQLYRYFHDLFFLDFQILHFQSFFKVGLFRVRNGATGNLFVGQKLTSLSLSPPRGRVRADRSGWPNDISD